MFESFAKLTVVTEVLIPPTIAGLQCWTRADRGIVFGGTGVLTWQDQSGNGNDFSAAAPANEPVFVSIEPTANNRSVIRFNGVDDYFDAPNFSALTGGGEVFIVIKAADGLVNSGHWEFGNSTIASLYPFANDLAVFDGFASTTRPTTGRPDTTLQQFNNYNVISIAGEWTSLFNGVAHFSRGNVVGWSTTAKLGSSAPAQIFLGGDIAEFILYDNKLAAGDRVIIENYLAVRYGMARQGNDSFTKFLLHMDGVDGGATFKDVNVGGGVHTWTAGTGATEAVTSATQKKFGVTSCGTSLPAGLISTPDSTDFTLGTADWTVDYWVKMGGAGGVQQFHFGQADAAATNTSVFVDFAPSNVIRLFVFNTVGTQFVITGTSTFSSASPFAHVACVRVGNILKLFINGVQEGGDLAFNETVRDSTTTMGVGRLGLFATSGLNGFIDEWRYSVGIARFTSNFTPPIRPYD